MRPQPDLAELRKSFRPPKLVMTRPELRDAFAAHCRAYQEKPQPRIAPPQGQAAQVGCPNPLSLSQGGRTPHPSFLCCFLCCFSC